jgi:hypothetical protein
MTDLDQIRLDARARALRAAFLRDAIRGLAARLRHPIRSGARA